MPQMPPITGGQAFTDQSGRLTATGQQILQAMQAPFSGGGSESGQVAANTAAITALEGRMTGAEGNIDDLGDDIAANVAEIDAIQAGQIIFASFTAANIASIAHAVNTTAKFTGKTVRDSTNKRLMVADGAAAADTWTVADGSASVTPS